jgi:pSer/pThr/pTyr-binding forkhead associated (FHA) protein
MNLSLVVNDGAHKGKVVPIGLSQFLIGRDPQCHLRPASPMISKRHCALLVKGGKVLVRDLDSTNGTFVNQEQVKKERQLQNGDELKIGPLAFLVRIEAEVPEEKVVAAKPSKKKSAESVEDESAAALLLELGEGEEASPQVPVDSEGIATGSTVMDMPSPDLSEGKPGSGKTPPPKPASADTSDAAKAILDKYSRRRRT